MATPRLSPISGELVRSARCSDGIVTLDVERDLYLSLYDPQTVDDSPSGKGPSYPAAVGRDGDWQVLETLSVRPTLREIIRFVRVALSVRKKLHNASFASLLEDVRQMQFGLGDSPCDPATIQRATAVFERLRHWLPGNPLCLARAYFLLRFLAAHGQRAEWVFGVSLFPFAAHCWVASGTTVLGDRADLLPRFTVILAVDRDYL